MGVWQVRGRWVIGIRGRCSAQSVGKPPLAGNFIGANVRWRILNLLNFCHRTILLDRNSSVWANTHGTLVGGCGELICGWQATSRSMAGSYKSAFRSVSGHPPASVEGGYKPQQNTTKQESFTVGCIPVQLHPWYFQEPHWKSMGLPEISRVTWQIWGCAVPYAAIPYTHQR